MLDVSDEVRAEIGDPEADRLLAGENAPATYDCTSCRTPGHTDRERTSTVLFIGEETAVLAFAHASCIPSQVVPVSEEQLQGAVRSITAGHTGEIGQQGSPNSAAAQTAPGQTAPAQAVLGITAGLVMCRDALYPSLVVEPTGPVGRPGGTGAEDEFLTLLAEQGFHPVEDLDTPPGPCPVGWSVLLASGKLHAVLQPGTVGGSPTAWWQAHQPLTVSDGWRAEVNRTNKVLVFAAPAGTIGRQPREDMLREALLRAMREGKLAGGMMPLAGT
jgi:hypothetical protein